MAFGSILSYHGLTILCSRSCYTILKRSKCISLASFWNKEYFCSGDHVKIYTRRRSFAESLAFLLQFTNTGCQISSFACGGVQQQCFTENNVQELASAIQKWNFLSERPAARKSSQKD